MLNKYSKHDFLAQKRLAQSQDSSRKRKEGITGERQYSDEKKDSKKTKGARPFLDSLLGLLGRKAEPASEEKAAKGTSAAKSFNYNPLTPKETRETGDDDKDAASPPKDVSDYDSFKALQPKSIADSSIIPASSLIPIPYSALSKGPRFPTYLVESKHSEHLFSARPSREQLKKIWKKFHGRSKNLNNMKSYIQFVTVPTGDTPGTSIMLHYDHRRYLFGHIGEGTMRACNELGISLRKVQKIFVSGRTTRETSGGLLGMLLTLADANAAATANANTNVSAKESKKRVLKGQEENTDINVYGPPNLVHSVAAARKFIFRKSTPTTITDFSGAEDSGPYQRGGEHLPRVFDDNMDVFLVESVPKSAESETSRLKDAVKRRAMDDSSDEQQDLVRQRIINDMFNSKWRLDTLVEKYLHEVELPAKIWYRDQETKDLKEYTGPLPPDPAASKTLKVFVRNPWPAAMAPNLPPTMANPMSLSYIVRGRVTRGKFDKQKAIALGVKPGPMFSKLASGESVPLDDGRVVKSEQVLGPDIQAGGFALIDLPTQAHVESHAFSHNALNEPERMAGVKTMIWLLGPGVSDAQLRGYIRNKKEVTHIISSPDLSANQLVAHGAATSAIKLAQVDKDHFPVPYFDDAQKPAPNFRREAGFWPKESDTWDEVLALPNVFLAQRGMTVQLDPELKIEEKDAVAPLNTLELITTPQSAEVIELAKEVRQSAASGPLAEELKQWRKSVPHEDVEIVTLGTGSAMPSRYRNVSANLVRVPGWGSYLLDAGENTLGQLQRVYKPHELIEVLRDLRMIWISHGHADHHLGTVSVIKAWYDVVHGPDTTYPAVSPEVVELLKREFDDNPSNEPADLAHRPKYLAVMGNRFLMDYLYEISQVEDYGYSHILPVVNTSDKPGVTQSTGNAVFPHTSIILPRPGTDPWISNFLGSSARVGLLGLHMVRAINVRHCNGARAVFLKFRPTKFSRPAFSIAYSGDCRPSSTFAEYAKDATVLIHEATFDDDLGGEARAKKHSTVQEAIGVASLMQAKSLILTHFSQRYQKIPVLDDVWGKAAKVEEAIKREGENRDAAGAKGPGAGEDVDEIADGAEELPATATTYQAPDEPEEMEVDQTRPAESASPTDKEIPILFAFDYMRVRVGDMPMLKAYRPALTKLFEDEIEELEERKIKRAGNAAMDAAGLKRSGSSRSLASQKKKSAESPGKKLKATPKKEIIAEPANEVKPVPEKEQTQVTRNVLSSDGDGPRLSRRLSHGPDDAKDDGLANFPHEL